MKRTKLFTILMILAIVSGVGLASAAYYTLLPSNIVQVTVDPGETKITPNLTASSANITLGASVTLTADCTTNWANKPVSFYDGTTLLTGSPVTTNANGVASLTVTPTTTGLHYYQVKP